MARQPLPWFVAMYSALHVVASSCSLDDRVDRHHRARRSAAARADSLAARV